MSLHFISPQKIMQKGDNVTGKNLSGDWLPVGSHTTSTNRGYNNKTVQSTQLTSFTQSGKTWEHDSMPTGKFKNHPSPNKLFREQPVFSLTLPWAFFYLKNLCFLKGVQVYLILVALCLSVRPNYQNTRWKVIDQRFSTFGEWLLYILE